MYLNEMKLHDAHIIEFIIGKMNIVREELTESDLQRIKTLIIRTENALACQFVKVLWEKVGRFVSTDKLPVACVNNPAHQVRYVKLEKLYSKMGIGECYECRIGMLLPKPGEKINNLTLLSLSSSGRGSYNGLFRCDCGKERTFPLALVLRGENKTCGDATCVLKRKGHIDWHNARNKRFGWLRCGSVVGVTANNNAIVEASCARRNCIDPENGTVNKNSSSLANGEFHNCPCGAWIAPSESNLLLELEQGQRCNCISFAYRFLCKERQDNSVSLDIFTRQIRRYTSAISVKGKITKIPLNVLQSFLIPREEHLTLPFTAYLIWRDDVIIYAGITVNTSRRFEEHMKSYANKKIAESVKVYGEGAHRIEPVDTSTDFDKISALEVELIKQHDLIKNGCNRRIGGAANPLATVADIDATKRVLELYEKHASEGTPYPKKAEVAAELKISNADINRIFAKLLRWNAVEKYKQAGRELDELSEDDMKGIENDLKELKVVSYVAKNYDVKLKHVVAIRQAVLAKHGRLSQHGNVMTTDVNQRQFIAWCLEYGFPMRWITQIGEFVPTHNSLGKMIKEYESLYTHEDESVIYNNIVRYVREHIDEKLSLPKIKSPLTKNGQCGYRQQVLLVKIVDLYTSTGRTSGLNIDGNMLSPDIVRESIKLVREGQNLVLRNSVKCRVDYKDLRKKVDSFEKSKTNFGRI